MPVCILTVQQQCSQRMLSVIMTATCITGSVWHTLAAIGSNFDQDGYYNLRRLSWPETFVGSSLEDLQEHDFFGRGSPEAYHELFRQGGKTWATLKNLNIAHKYFKEIKGTGVLGIFPFGLKSNDIKVSQAEQEASLLFMCCGPPNNSDFVQSIAAIAIDYCQYC